jgi:hypothetical protein
MLAYWKTRRKFFGEERAFLPLTMTGALAQDVEVIAAGIYQILPKDQKGRGVLFLDRIRAIPPLASREAVVSIMVVLKKEILKG